jgi:cobaltochelatase CobT
MGADHFKPSRTGVHLEHEVSSKRDWAIPSRKDYVIRKLGGERANPYFKSSDVSSIIDGHTKPLSAKLRHKLQVRSKGRYEYGKKEGKLHNGSLHRLVSGRGSEQEKRVFRQHIVSDTLDTAVSLLVDCSGSMQGSKFEMACAAAASVGLALMPLHIPYTILGFTNDDSGRDNPVINVFSQWGEAANQTSLVKRFSEASNYLYQNSDGDGIAWAYSDLMQRKEKRRILIVISDGSPAGRGWAGDVSGYTKHVIQSIEKGKAASIYGVGIMDNNVKKYYTKNVVINKVESLSSAILSILDKEI